MYPRNLCAPIERKSDLLSYYIKKIKNYVMRIYVSKIQMCVESKRSSRDGIIKHWEKSMRRGKSRTYELIH